MLLANAFIDGGALRTYRHAPNTGSRKSWAAGDATSRAVWLALNAIKGEMGYPSALSASVWGFEECLPRQSVTDPGARFWFLRHGKYFVQSLIPRRISRPNGG